MSMKGTKEQVTEAMTKWYTLAREELSALAGYRPNHKPHKFRWECAVGNKKTSNSTALAAAWRELARRSDDLAKINRTTASALVSNAKRQAINSHRKDIQGISEKLAAGVPPSLVEELRSWTVHYNRAAALESDSTSKKLSNLADIKAAKLEAAT